MSHKIAIVGAGPSGCYTAQTLVKILPDAEITIIDQLPTPFGLVRYGVAPDHQGTKAVSRQFSRLFEKQGVCYIGNLEVGRDLPLPDLQEMMDAVVLATGLHADRTLDVEGCNLDRIYGSGEVTRYWNAHPDSENFEPEFGETVIILGNGNVAVDLIRLLAKSEDEFSGSDFNPALVNHAVKTIHVIGRSPLETAKFDPAMIRELGAVQGLSCQLAAGDKLQVTEDNQISVALNELFSRPNSKTDKTLMFHSGWQTERFNPSDNRVSSITVRNTTSDAMKDIECSSVISAIGFDHSGDIDRKGLLLNAEAIGDGVLSPGLFAAGWFKRGPNGTIPQNRQDSQQVANKIKEWLENTSPEKPGRSAILERFSKSVTSYEDWLTIDEIETRFAAANRCRQKISSRELMMNAIEQQRNVS
ncbi:MAG: FAD-dependent oxidoreductase [Pseudomonadota bacterium]